MVSTHMSAERPSKRARLLFEDHPSEDSEGEIPAELNTSGQTHNRAEKPLKINNEYARRFEHNKKREELQKCSLSILQSSFNSRIVDGS